MYIHPINDILNNERHIFSIYENSMINFVISYHLFRFTVNLCVKLLSFFVAYDRIFPGHQQKSRVRDAFKDPSLLKKFKRFFLRDDILRRDLIAGIEYILTPFKLMFHFLFLQREKFIWCGRHQRW